MDALIVSSLFVGLAAASLRWGHDSRFGDGRFGLGDVSFDDVEAHVQALHQQARVEALVRAAPERTARPALHRRALGGVGVLMVALGRRLEGYGERIVVPSRLAATSDCSIQRGL